MATLTGSVRNDVLRGRERSDDFLKGGAGDDVLFGFTGRDALFGDSGNDRLYGGDGRDTLRGHGGDDRLEGGKDADHLIGGSGADRLFGQQGDDYLRAESDGKVDVLFGGSGNDTLFGASGEGRPDGVRFSDVLVGGAGNDTYHISSGEPIDKAAADPGVDTVVVYANVDYTLGPHQENLTDYFGNSNHGALRGNAGANVMTGFSDSILYGMGGDDVFVANPYFVDLIDGGNGHDSILLPPSSQAWFENFRYDVRNIEILDAEDGFVFEVKFDLSPEEVLDITDHRNVLRIHGEATDVVDSESTWTYTGTVAERGRVYDQYTAGGATLRIDPDLRIAFDFV
ncbi:MAG: hypothetical protein K2Y51_12000 [Gammaproteobacteria bacterium]|nr:hypothetical protein [Gammaproteobacteria bacterium]